MLWRSCVSSLAPCGVVHAARALTGLAAARVELAARRRGERFTRCFGFLGPAFETLLLVLLVDGLLAASVLPLALSGVACAFPAIGEPTVAKTASRPTNRNDQRRARDACICGVMRGEGATRVPVTGLPAPKGKRKTSRDGGEEIPRRAIWSESLALGESSHLHEDVPLVHRPEDHVPEQHEGDRERQRRVNWRQPGEKDRLVDRGLEHRRLTLIIHLDDRIDETREHTGSSKGNDRVHSV